MYGAAKSSSSRSSRRPSPTRCIICAGERATYISKGSQRRAGCTAAPNARQTIRDKAAGGTIEEYQAFALAVKYGGGGAEDGGFGGVRDPYAEKMRQPGGGKAYDWGETSLDEMIGAFGGVPAQTARPDWHDALELTAVEKFIAFNNERLEGIGGLRRSSIRRDGP